MKDQSDWPEERAVRQNGASGKQGSMEPRKKALFELGQVVATPGALQALQEAGQKPAEFLARHVTGDWDNLDPHDRQENERAVKEGRRVFSAYQTNKGVKLWVITEWDRSVTTLLLPREY